MNLRPFFLLNPCDKNMGSNKNLIKQRKLLLPIKPPKTIATLSLIRQLLKP